MAHFDAVGDAIRYTAVQTRRNLRERWERTARRRSARGGSTAPRPIAMPKVLFIYGTRPEAIKLAPVIIACRQRGRIEPVICVTAQHRELLDEINEPSP